MERGGVFVIPVTSDRRNRREPGTFPMNAL